MFMHHVAMTKAFDPGVTAIDQAFQHAGLRQVASGDSWRLGSGDGLVLCQLMPISGQEACHIITVAASEDQQAMGVADTVSRFIQGIVKFDDNG